MAKTRKILKAENAQLVDRNRGFASREINATAVRTELEAKLKASEAAAAAAIKSNTAAVKDLTLLQAQARLTCEAANKPNDNDLHDELVTLEAMLPKEVAAAETVTSEDTSIAAAA